MGQIYKIKKFHPKDAYSGIIEGMIGTRVILDPGHKPSKPRFKFYRKCYCREVLDDGTLNDFLYFFIGVQLQPTGEIFNGQI